MDRAKWQNIKDVLSAILESTGEERSEFLAHESEEIRLEVGKLLAAHDRAAGFIDEPLIIERGLAEVEPEEALLGRQIDNYLLLEKIGAGGMGNVYLAERLNSDFKQKVALKLIKRGMDSEAILKRFERERRILSSLKHPNIAQLIDGGISSEGRPYFVMEYVEGKPLNLFCRDNGLNLEERLKVFRRICAAVEHAHKNLVVHRDLKPSNIIVTDDRIPKLLDFGIAKLLTDDNTETTNTTALGRVFTPEYASPEQILGKNVTTASDVYSLGVILYELLSGVKPYRFENCRPDEFANVVLTEEPVRPSEISDSEPRISKNGTLPNKDRSTTPSDEIEDSKFEMRNPRLLRGDLDNIILKALRKDPSERYGSVRELSEDLSRFSNGLPVLARPQTIGYRFEKYFKRHRLGVLAATLVLISLTVGFSVAAWQAIVAKRERARAEQRFKDIRRLANSLLFEVHDSIQNLPGSTPARELLVRRALEYLDKLAAEDGKDLSLKMELADAYDRIGDIQGGLRTSHLGQREKAGESYKKALSIRESLIKADPSNPAYRRKLAASYKKSGDMLWLATEVPESLKMYERAFEINKKLGEDLPQDPGIRFDLARSYVDFGYSLAVNGRTDESLKKLRFGVVMLEKISAEKSGDQDELSELAKAYDRLAETLESLTGQFSESLAYYRKSQAISEQLLAANPQNTKFKRGVAVSYFDIATVQTKLRDNQNALKNSKRSFELFSALLKEDPQNAEFRQIVVAVDIQVSGLLILVGEPREAIDRMNRSLPALEKLYSDSPSDEIARFRIANVYETLGRGYSAIASDRQEPVSQPVLLWKQARENLIKSFVIYKSFRDAGATVGDDAAKVDDIAAEIAKCDAALSNKKLSR